MKKGFLYGETADERPCTTIENPSDRGPARDDLPRDGHRAEMPSSSRSGPFYVTKDGKGKPIRDLFARG